MKVVDVNSAVRRALAFRVALFLIMMVAVIGFGALSPMPPPWPALIGFFLVFGIVAMSISIVTDRRFAVRAGRVSPPWTGSNARWVRFAYPVPFHKALDLAERALTQVGAEDIETVNDLMVTGWIGSALANLPQWQQYQLAVELFAAPDGTTVFTSCARPRWSSALLGASQSQLLASSLQNNLWFLIREG
jgi:hypothetical protein